VPRLNLDEVQDAFLSALETAIPQKVVEQAIPDIDTVERYPDGSVKVYVALQFGDLMEGQTHSAAGPIGDDYIVPVYVQAVAPSAEIARKVANRVVSAVLGESFQWSGSVRKRLGGGLWPIVGSNGATEAYLAPASFSVPMQLAWVEDDDD